MPQPSGRSPLLRLRILLWHARPFLAVGATLLLGLGVVRALAPPPPPTVAVVVASRDVASGAELSATDLRVVRFPPHLVPDDALRADDDALGRRTAVDLSAGIVLVRALLAGERFAVTPPDGSVIVPVRLSTASTAGLLRPGDRIDLVAPAGTAFAGTVPADAEWWSLPGATTGAEAGTAPSGTTPEGPPPVSSSGPEPVTLAHGALVLDVDGAPDPDEASQPGVTGGLVPPADEDGMTVVAVTPEEGRRLASATVREVLAAVLLP